MIIKLFVLLFLNVVFANASKDDLPTLYEYYTEGGIKSGLSDGQSYFTLNNRNITIYSGSLHYFRVPRAYWRDRMKKMRAAGLNTVASYIPWNLHEPHSGVYDFGKGGSEMEDFLHIEEFFKTAQEEDLLVLIRPGPYINSEWEMGGLPSWISRNVTLPRNSQDKFFLTFAKRYFDVLFPVLVPYQFQKGGPIVGFQIENEFGNKNRSDSQYMNKLKQMFLDNNITELLFTADRPKMHGIGAIPGILQTANFGSDSTNQLNILNTLQTNKPSLVMEYWAGWWDHWTNNHSTVDAHKFNQYLTEILDYPASVNMYIFVGSTSFGFTNGATVYTKNNSGLQPIINSYDYDAPITEYGAYTDKYSMTRQAVLSRTVVQTKLPDEPLLKYPIAYKDILCSSQLLLSEILNSFKNYINSENVVPMEMLPINGNSGQSFGYIVYRKTNITLPAGAVLKIPGYVSDTILVLVNGKLVCRVPQNSADLDSFGFWRQKDSTLSLTTVELSGATIDLVVENFGRSSQGATLMKGLQENVYINDKEITNWQIAPLEFKKSWTNSLSGWHSVKDSKATPAFYTFILNIEGEPEDTYVDMREWKKGLIIVNGFVLSRYFFLGPQQTAYLPAPFLETGSNTIVVYEHYDATDTLKFATAPIWETKS